MAFLSSHAGAQEQFEVTNFIGITHRSFFDQPSIDDYTRGFPRVEFQVRRPTPRQWLPAKVRISVEGEVRKKKEYHYPVHHENETLFPILDENTTSFSAPLPSYFQDAAITSVTMVLLEGTARLPSKTILAKPRIVSLNSLPTASYEDDHISLLFTFSTNSDEISVSGKNLTAQAFRIPGLTPAGLEADVKDLPLPPVTRELHYVSGSVVDSSFNVGPGAPFVLEVKLADRRACQPQVSSQIEIEPDPICKRPGPLLMKYAKELTDGYMVVRLLLPVFTDQGIRDYSFTFVLTNQSSSPKKKDPAGVSV